MKFVDWIIQSFHILTYLPALIYNINFIKFALSKINRIIHGMALLLFHIKKTHMDTLLKQLKIDSKRLITKTQQTDIQVRYIHTAHPGKEHLTRIIFESVHDGLHNLAALSRWFLVTLRKESSSPPEENKPFILGMMPLCAYVCVFLSLIFFNEFVGFPDAPYERIIFFKKTVFCVYSIAALPVFEIVAPLASDSRSLKNCMINRSS